MRIPRPFFVAALLALVPLAGCYNDPNEQLDEMQQTLDLANALDELDAKTAELQFTMDSLRTVVARQDSTIATLANLAGVRYVR